MDPANAHPDMRLNRRSAGADVSLGTESESADSVGPGSISVIALPPQDEEELAYRSSIEAILTSVASLSDISCDGDESPADPRPRRPVHRTTDD